jgi:pyridoxal/pyridoxine/pyridoxamine kinase
MAVRRSAAELFLVTPNIFELQYLLKDNDHPYINRIKTCALTNCSVDYTPTGSYMTFPDGSYGFLCHKLNF